jgi:hypothetical protein
MKRQVMQPFRAPRKNNDKASPSRQSPRRQILPDSEEAATELGLVWPLIIKETQYSDIEKIMDNGERNIHGQIISIEANSERSPVRHHHDAPFPSSTASPNCSEFEAFLDKAKAATMAANKMSKTDAYWENVLQGEKQRLAAVNKARTISVDEILFGESSTVADSVQQDESDDDNIPIVATLGTHKSNLALLVDVATLPNSPSILKKKKTPKVSLPFLSLTPHR